MCKHHGVERDQPQVVSLEGMHRRDIVRSLWAGTMVLGVSATVGGCETVGAMLTPSDDQLVQMAGQAWEQTKAETPISRDAAANQRLQNNGWKIAQAANRPNDAWEFVVFDSPDLNAFVLPGGKVGFYKGLMDFVDNDHQLAAILGHEVGHVTARHAAQRMGQHSATALGLSIAGIALGAGGLRDDQRDAVMAIAGAGATVGILLPFSRDNESQADKLGADYMHIAGYNVRESVTLWQKMAAASQGRQQEWMSTHPDPNRRARELEDYIRSRGYA